jgi:hypothetical protein
MDNLQDGGTLKVISYAVSATQRRRDLTKERAGECGGRNLAGEVGTMGQHGEPSGPQFRADRPSEQEAVRTTIVGGRPPGSGQPVGKIPRGIEILLKKASIDPAFRELLLGDRAAAAQSIGLTLDPAEVLMLTATPAEQLQAIIAQTVVPHEHRRAFLGQAAAAMLAALGAVTSGCEGQAPTKGIRPDGPPSPDGVRPDRIPVTKGIQPDRPESFGGEDPGPTRGIRPDVPSPKEP